MQLNEGDAQLRDRVTERIIGCASTVANTLGHGFIGKVYENALAHEMRKHQLGAVQQRGIVIPDISFICLEKAAVDKFDVARRRSLGKTSPVKSIERLSTD